ncbi:alpha/beta hydrolase [Nocardiopsis sp. RSe5-2]|uniref:Alpha/beta hydrolase n=1 Tax=Nocardiopsis endophytica TaxID=3018445 RepID=A0ABT4U719_9ACTN|nr:alpha/beta hydrolase [Nocardiopsis endophytica]MDA2812741.1 alpha/beta hydrolase [Nocardiopsis endophytica]
MTDFVLIHGTTQSPAGWDLLREALAQRGHTGIPIDLPGDPALGVEDHARIAAGQIPARVRAPVVVAHSGSGALLPAVAGAVGAGALVWLAAYVPDTAGGRSLLEEAQADPAAMFAEDWIGVDPSSDHDAARRFLFHDCAKDVQEWALSTLRMFAPPEVYRSRPATGRPEGRSTYILPTADRTLRPDWMRRAALERLGVRPVELASGHCPHVSRPEETADILGTVQPLVGS